LNDLRNGYAPQAGMPFGFLAESELRSALAVSTAPLGIATLTAWTMQVVPICASLAFQARPPPGAFQTGGVPELVSKTDECHPLPNLINI
jgi:hypothetical protein